MAAEALHYNPIQFTPSLSPQPNDFVSPFQPLHSSVNRTKDVFSKSDYSVSKILPKQEEFQNSKNLFDKDLSKIDVLQTTFNTELDITEELKLNYNPVLARWKFEELKTDEQRAKFRIYESWQLQTTFRERYHAAKSSVNYTIGADGEIYNELFPDEPFERVLRRGLEYQKAHNSKDIEREQKEYDGWVQICNTLKDPTTPVNSKAIVMSGPGVANGSMYKDNFVDIYEALIDPVTEKRFIKMTRNASGLTFEEYAQIAKDFEHDYFEGFAGPIDAWFLGKPIYRNPALDPRTTDELVDKIFGIRESAMKEEDFQKVWEKLTPLRQYYMDVLCSPSFKPREIAIALNAMLKKGDELKKKVKFTPAGKAIEDDSRFENIKDEVNFLGMQNIETVLAACGASAGFKMNSRSSSLPNEPTVQVLSNSVGKFGIDEDNHGPLDVECPNEDCKAINHRDFGKLLDRCKICNSDAIACKNHKDEENVTKPKPKINIEEPKKDKKKEVSWSPAAVAKKSAT